MKPIDTVEHIIAKYPPRIDYLIPMLQDLQGQRGYLPRKDLETISRITNISLNRIYGVATFYSQFSLTPKGRHTISVCSGTACHVKGSDQIIRHLEEKLNIKVGEVTADKLIALEQVRCIGACSLAPAVMIDDKVHGKLTIERVDELITELQKQSLDN